MPIGKDIGESFARETWERESTVIHVCKNTSKSEVEIKLGFEEREYFKLKSLYTLNRIYFGSIIFINSIHIPYAFNL